MIWKRRSKRRLVSPKKSAHVLQLGLPTPMEIVDVVSDPEMNEHGGGDRRRRSPTGHVVKRQMHILTRIPIARIWRSTTGPDPTRTSEFLSKSPKPFARWNHTYVCPLRTLVYSALRSLNRIASTTAASCVQNATIPHALSRLCVSFEYKDSPDPVSPRSAGERRKFALSFQTGTIGSMGFI